MDVNIFIVSPRLGSFLLSHLDLDSNTRKCRLSTVCVRVRARVCVCLTSWGRFALTSRWSQDCSLWARRFSYTPAPTGIRKLDWMSWGLWGGTFECAIFDVRVFNPRARSNEARRSSASVFRRHEQHKRRQYDQRVRDVEMASFAPLGCVRRLLAHMISPGHVQAPPGRLAAQLAMPHSAVMGWLRCRVSFSLRRD